MKGFKKKTINCRYTELIKKQISLRNLEIQAWTWVEFEDKVWRDQTCSDIYSEQNLSVRGDLGGRDGEKPWKRRGSQI